MLEAYREFKQAARRDGGFEKRFPSLAWKSRPTVRRQAISGMSVTANLLNGGFFTSGWVNDVTSRMIEDLRYSRIASTERSDIPAWRSSRIYYSA